MAEPTTKELKQLAANVRVRLDRHADSAYREKISKLVPTEIEIVGVRVPVIRTLVKEFHGEHADLSSATMMALLDHAFAKPCREELLFVTIRNQRQRNCLQRVARRSQKSNGRVSKDGLTGLRIGKSATNFRWGLSASSLAPI